MFVGIGVGVHRQRFAGSFATSYSSRVIADGGTIEALDCVAAASSLLQSASLLIIPSGYKAGVAYAELPANGNGDLTWSRNSVANRTQSDGNIGSVAANVPRLSYMYGSCPALLLEPQRTNLALWSEQFDNTYWDKNNVTVTANDAVAPDGTMSADKVTLSSTSARVQRVVTLTNNTQFTLSTFVKNINASNSLVGIACLNNANINCQGNFTLTGNGSVFSQSNCIASITPFGNGWYRCSIVFNSESGANNPIIRAISNVTGSGGLTNNESVYIWGTQLEQGAYPTTYIQTTNATATRLVDTFTRNNIYTNGLITSGGGTWYVELRGNVSYTRDNSGETLGIGDTISLATNSLIIRNGGTSRLQIFKRISSATTTLYTTTTDIVKIAIKWNGTTADVFVNGIKGVSATAFATTNMEFLNGWGQQQPIFIQQMALYPTPLSDTECQILTA